MVQYRSLPQSLIQTRQIQELVLACFPLVLTTDIWSPKMVSVFKKAQEEWQKLEASIVDKTLRARKMGISLQLDLPHLLLFLTFSPSIDNICFQITKFPHNQVAELPSFSCSDPYLMGCFRLAVHCNVGKPLPLKRVLEMVLWEGIMTLTDWKRNKWNCWEI